MTFANWFFLPFQNEISIWFEMRYHFSCFHNWLSKIVQSLSKSATFSKGSLANNPNGKIFFHFKWENTFHMIEKTSSDRKLQDRKGLVYSTSLHVWHSVYKFCTLIYITPFHRFFCPKLRVCPTLRGDRKIRETARCKQVDRLKKVDPFQAIFVSRTLSTMDHT